MSKPNGLVLAIGNDGLPSMFVRPHDRVADKIWDAVSEAVIAGWTPEQFRTEALSSWVQAVEDESRAQKSDAVNAFKGGHLDDV
jgi:hypothetical protein